VIRLLSAAVLSAAVLQAPTPSIRIAVNMTTI